MSAEKIILYGAVAVVLVLFIRQRINNPANVGGLMYAGAQPGCVNCLGQVA